MKRIKSLLAIGTAIFTFCSIITNASAYTILRKAGFSPYPTTLQCYYDFSNATKTDVSLACSAWNSAAGKTLVTKSVTTHSEENFNSNNLNQITRGFRGTNSYIMKHQVMKGNINYQSNEGDIDINVSYPFGTASTSYDMLSNLTHEIGHFLGLGHSSLKSSVMYEDFAPGETRTIKTDDKNGIKAIYN